MRAIRATNVFKTISDEATYVVAAIMPIDIHAEEMKRVYDRRMLERSTARGIDIRWEERLVSLAQWQNRWEWQNRWYCSPKGRWTYRLIPDLETWISRKHGEVNYYLTQLLSDHGCFRNYWHRFGHDSSPYCPNCSLKEANTEHIITICPRFRAIIEEVPTGESIVDHMLQCEENWLKISAFAKNALTELRSLERQRRLMEQ